MFSSSLSNFMWIVTPFNTARVWCMGNDGFSYNGSPSNLATARPSINLKSEFKIISGKGTYQEPFEIEM